jgi:hypothetical protein
MRHRQLVEMIKEISRNSIEERNLHHRYKQYTNRLTGDRYMENNKLAEDDNQKEPGTTDTGSKANKVEINPESGPSIYQAR